MDTALAIKQDQDGAIIESVVVNGDLSKLSARERVDYYRAVCDSLGINPFTKPFDYISLNGKLTLYARKDATDQLRDKKAVSLAPVKRDMNTELGIYLVEVEASMQNGRRDFATGAVNIKNLSGDALANAIMKAETKAKRRATLSICGLGWMDETETETVREARPVKVTEQGEIITEDNQPINTTWKPADTLAETTTHPEPTTQPDTALTYAAPVATIGKHKYPMQWGRLLAAYTRANPFEVDGILQILKLPQETKPEQVVEHLNAYLAQKAAAEPVAA
jgi:hypothetical protein